MNKTVKNVFKTDEVDYTNRLVNRRDFGFKRHIRRYIDFQFPYRWNLKSLKPGLTLEIGCGIGRNLSTLKDLGIGIDHNQHSVEVAKSNGLIAFTPDEFQASSFNKFHTFDSLLLSHVAEHMKFVEVVGILNEYLSLLKPNGKVIIMTPQEVGYRSDPTHVEFMDFSKLRDIAAQINFRVTKEYSFPFLRFVGHLFIYNEFISVSELNNIKD